MKKNKLAAILRYRFDNMMSRGTMALVGILFTVTAVVIVLAAAVASLIGGGTLRSNVWTSIMHTIDAGTISGTDTADLPFVILMCIVTLCGLFITSILIGIITTGFEERFSALKKGNSAVIEKGHTLILGFNDGIYTFISELIKANENKKDACIVVLAAEDKEEVETAINEHVGNSKTTRIIVRTGNITDATMLNRCALTKARSVIVNSQEDFMVVKAILAINSILDTIEQGIAKPHIVATITNKQNYEAAMIAGSGNVELLLASDIIARIIAQTSRQSGLSNVLIELFDYDGDELYFESIPELTGSTFENTLLAFEKAIAFGIKRNDQIMLNPPMDEIIKEGDQLILLVEDDGMAKVNSSPPNLDKAKVITPVDNCTPIVGNLLILGLNNMIGLVLRELDTYFAKGTIVTIADSSIADDLKEETEGLENIRVTFHTCDTCNRKNLDMLVTSTTQRVLLLSNDTCDTEEADAMTLMRLIHLRDIAQKKQMILNITSEIKNPANQRLATVAEVNDLVVGSNIVNLALTQIAENRKLSDLFRELLQADGAEIHMRKIENYVELDNAIDFYSLTSIASKRGEIAVGYKKQIKEGIYEIITNPCKSESVSFTIDDYIIVVAND